MWSVQKKLHIYVQESKAVSCAVQAFTNDKQDCHVHLNVDNTIAGSLINRTGETRSSDLVQVAKKLCGSIVSEGGSYWK